MTTLNQKAERAGIDAGEIVKNLNLGKSTVYAILNGNYRGKKEVKEAVEEYIEERFVRINVFETLDQKVFMKGLEFALNDKEFSAISGPTGIGKTHVCKEFAYENEKVIYYKVVEGIGWKSTLGDISRLLARSEHGTCSDMMHNIMDAIKTSGVKMLIIDEVEHLFKQNHRGRFLERIAFFREIHEYCGIGVVIVGLDILESELRYASKTYITNRIDCLMKGDPADVKDLREFWIKILGMPADTTAEAVFLKAKERGNFRILVKLAEKAKAMGGRVDAALNFVFI